MRSIVTKEYDRWLDPPMAPRVFGLSSRPHCYVKGCTSYLDLEEAVPCDCGALLCDSECLSQHKKDECA